MPSPISLLSIWLAALGSAVVTAQSITASNGTETASSNVTVGLTLFASNHQVVGSVVGLLPLTSVAGEELSSAGLSGGAVLTTPSNQLSLTPADLAFISCDLSAYTGDIGPVDVFATADQAQVKAIIFYSLDAAWCDLQGYGGTYSSIYSFKNMSGSRAVVEAITADPSTQTGTPTPKTVAVVSLVSATGNGTATSSAAAAAMSSADTQNPLGPSPGTAVAMIILYSITGIITVLFLIIIVTGAIRAHRHPERYGPRNIIGRARQSRARGLARAMLDSLPIVKVGEADEVKPGDVELGGAVSPTPDGSGSADPHENSRSAAGPDAEGGAGAEITEVDGIAAASTTARVASPPAARGYEGCSICTEDFEVGQDQRVLPCDHRFHPACIDPWLLNVSGTCPLCRIDLRPQASRTDEAELDEDGHPIERDDGATVDGMAPPLGMAGDGERSSNRRSLMLSIMGIGRPDRMTREERVLALRNYRRRQATAAAARRRQTQASPSHPAAAAADPAVSEDVLASPTDPELEGRVRRSLRNAFRVRTRRTGQPDEAAPSPVAGVAAESEPVAPAPAPEVHTEATS